MQKRNAWQVKQKLTKKVNFLVQNYIVTKYL